MVDTIVETIVSSFDAFNSLKYGKEILVFLISLMPILELRGGLIAASLLGLDPIPSYIISMIGNILPVPLILLFINRIMNYFRKKGILKKLVTFLDKKVEKNKKNIEKYGYWGLVLFVGVPLPGTGAWTGCLIASVLEMDRKKSFWAILLGVFIASIIMMIISFGLLR